MANDTPLEQRAAMNPSESHDTLGLRPLPAQVASLLQDLNAPPRLIAHLVLVHDVAFQLTDAIQRRWANVPFDLQSVLIGAALHDIGKVLHPSELAGPGHQHEQDGPGLLMSRGIESRLARFAQS